MLYQPRQISETIKNGIVSNKSFTKFFLQISFYSLLFCSFYFIAGKFFFPGFALSVLPFISVCLLFYFITLLVHYILLKASETQSTRFVRSFMITSMLKLFTYIVLLLVLVLMNKQNVTGYIIIFLALYLFYSVLETIALFRFLKK